MANKISGNCVKRITFLSEQVRSLPTQAPVALSQLVVFQTATIQTIGTANSSLKILISQTYHKTLKNTKISKRFPKVRAIGSELEELAI
jgi:hypothetical protein